MSNGKLIFIGLGLNDEKDISLKGLEEIKNCDKVYAEFYTAKLAGTNIEKLETLIGKNRPLIVPADHTFRRSTQPEVRTLDIPPVGIRIIIWLDKGN